MKIACSYCCKYIVFCLQLNSIGVKNLSVLRVLCGSFVLDFFAPSRLCEKYYFVWINFLRELRVKNLSVLRVLCGSL
jgi:hypothetical protein